MSAYLNVIYVGSEKHGVDINVGAEGKTDQWAINAFRSLRGVEVDIKTAPYLVDLHADNDDIVGTIGISIETFEKITKVPHRNWFSEPGLQQ